MKKGKNQIDLGVGWIHIDDDVEIHNFNARAWGWPSSTRAEIIAILTTLLVVKNSSDIKIYTDSKNTVNIFNSYKQRYNNYRSYIKLENQILWELIFKVIEMLDLNVILYKVKAHSEDRWNDRADIEANKGREGNLVSVNNSYSNYNYQLQYYNINIDTNPRNFIKKMNNIVTQKEFELLNRNKKLDMDNMDKNLSFKIVKEKYRKKGITISKFRNFKDHNLKAFNVKKLMNELPILETLKIRRPDLYNEHLKCIRCNEENEDLEHLWNCKAVSNDMLMIGIKSRRFLEKILQKEKYRDYLIDALFKYTILKKELSLFNTKENTEYYRKNKDTRFSNTYIWDGNGSLDTLMRGWIPSDLYHIMAKYITKKRKIEKYLISWLVKLNKWFHDRIWIPRNEKMIEWEKEQNITTKDKRASISRKREIRFEKKKKVKEKRDIRTIDTYHEIKQLMFTSKNLNKGHSYCVLSIISIYFSYIDRVINLSVDILVTRE